MKNQTISKKWNLLINNMDEVQRRRTAALKAMEFGRGGISKLSKITGMSRDTIRKGINEINSGQLERSTRLRKTGAGRKKAKDKNPLILQELNKLLDEITAGNPMSLLKWTNKSSYAIAKYLKLKSCDVSADTVRRILKERGYTMQANKKTKEGKSHPDRDKQFHYINDTVNLFIKNNQPVISVDAKKKELVGNFKNSGKTWRKKGEPKEVNAYDFRSLAKGKIVPYGTYDIALNKGFVNVGVSSDTSEFAVESIRQWWLQLGKKHYPNATKLLITADCGGSNGYRNRGWKYFLNEFARENNLRITVLHFPPATSKWNKIEHRLFSFISKNWAGEPLINYQIIINFIKNTATEAGLKVYARLDKKKYKIGTEFSDEQMKKISIEKHLMHPDWNYTILPND